MWTTTKTFFFSLCSFRSFSSFSYWFCFVVRLLFLVPSNFPFESPKNLNTFPIETRLQWLWATQWACYKILFIQSFRYDNWEQLNWVLWWCKTFFSCFPLSAHHDQPENLAKSVIITLIRRKKDPFERFDRLSLPLTPSMFFLR